MNENVSNNQSMQLKDIIEQKNLTMLFRGVRSIEVTDERIRKALGLFVSKVETKGHVSIADVLFSAYDIVGKCQFDEFAGNIVLCYDKNSDNKKILKNSAVGLYRLLSIHNGISLDLDTVGGSIAAAELQNYLIIPPNKLKKFIKLAEKEGIRLQKAGQVLEGNSIIITRGNDIIESLDKSAFTEVDSVDSISLGAQHFNDYLDGYNALLSYSLCDCISTNNVISFGLSDNIETVFARALGFFSAALYTKSFFNKVKFLSDNKVFTASPRPTVSDGDYFYLLKLRNDMFGLPDIIHYFQLKCYLQEYKKRGVIKNVLPYRENIEGVLNLLCSDSLTFDTFTNVSEKCFGIVVSVNRGELLNGIKLGCFKSI